jgi:GTP-binding protein Era
MPEPSENFRAGFIAVVGKPNTGKSTLINALLHQKIASVSPRPQTTRRRQLGILTTDDYQIVLVDTPGIHKPHHKLGDYMNQEALASLPDADVILWVVDASEMPDEEDEKVAESIRMLQPSPVVLLVLNKMDLAASKLDANAEAYQKLSPACIPMRISAVTGRGMDALLARTAESLPAGLPYYDEEQVTDLYERDIAVDLIREAVLNQLDDEVPHAVAVRLDEYTDQGEDRASISATLFVERESQKGIVIGRGGEMLKKIGTHARLEIERLTGRKIYLELHVKVKKNWRDDPNALKIMGFVADKGNRS